MLCTPLAQRKLSCEVLSLGCCTKSCSYLFFYFYFAFRFNLSYINQTYNSDFDRSQCHLLQNLSLVCDWVDYVTDFFLRKLAMLESGRHARIFYTDFCISLLWATHGTDTDLLSQRQWICLYLKLALSGKN